MATDEENETRLTAARLEHAKAQAQLSEATAKRKRLTYFHHNDAMAHALKAEELAEERYLAAVKALSEAAQFLRPNPPLEDHTDEEGNELPDSEWNVYHDMHSTDNFIGA